MNNFDITCHLAGGGQAILRHVTNNFHEPLLKSVDGGQTFNPVLLTDANTPADRELRVALYNAVRPRFQALHPNQQNWNNTETIDQHLQRILLGNHQPLLHYCHHCHNFGLNGVCEAYATSPEHVMRVLWMYETGPGNGAYRPWTFPNQAPVVRGLLYRVYTNATNDHPNS